MSPVHRTLASDVLPFDLAVETVHVRQELVAGRARSARTLVKEGALRVTLVGLAPGAALHEHEAQGPVTIHVLEGEIALDAGGGTQQIRAGALVALGPRVRHAAGSPGGGIFLLTMAAPMEHDPGEHDQGAADAG